MATMIGGDFLGRERLGRGIAWAKAVASLLPAASLGSANVTSAPATPRITYGASYAGRSPATRVRSSMSMTFSVSRRMTMVSPTLPMWAM